MRPARTLTARSVTVYTPPTSSRGYRSRTAAYMRWAKDLIFARCACMSDEDGMHQCRACRRLFTRTVVACRVCCVEIERERQMCEADGRYCEGAPAERPDNAQYLRLRSRLARWLRWRACVEASR